MLSDLTIFIIGVVFVVLSLLCVYRLIVAWIRKKLTGIWFKFRIVSVVYSDNPRRFIAFFIIYSFMTLFFLYTGVILILKSLWIV
ncbi:hypothetical protein KY348_00135 [Candidatus Woesearchaeota archaeon]|nr:hypothetical protein [Candidatus Woesearchaeota archaeon]